MAGERLDFIRVRGYRSIRECRVNLRRVNVLIGPNGAGKSNFISVFSLIQHILTGDLQNTVSRCGSSSLLYNGPKTTPSFEIEASFGNNGYGFELEPTDDGRMMFSKEYFTWNMSTAPFVIGNAHFESKWEEGVHNRTDNYIKPVLAAQSWRVYHFNDTSRSANMKQFHDIHDNAFLHQDAGNIAPFLLRLKEEHKAEYSRIIHTIRMVAPFFDDFVLIPNDTNDRIILRWKKKGYDGVMNSNQLSDGTLRFICLSTLLLQPVAMRPATIILDEPELGLFPQAMVYLVEMIESAGNEGQVVVSTQSADLVDEFSPEDIIVVEDRGNGTEFRRLETNRLKEWLENDYTMGQLWKKNLLSGGYQ